MYRADLGPKTAEFVLARQKGDGGFGATPHLPSTVEDTFYGLSILEALGLAKANDGRVKDSFKRAICYLQAVEPQPNWNPKTSYYYLLACHIAGTEPKQSAFHYDLLKYRDAQQSLEDVYYAYLVRERLRPHDGGPKYGRFSKINFCEWTTARELWFKLNLAPFVGDKKGPDKGKAGSWVRACQNPDGGFGFYPGSTSFIDNCYTCLKILITLGQEPADLEGVRGFILRCKTARGGFSRKNGGAPFLSATWHAVASLELLINLANGS